MSELPMQKFYCPKCGKTLYELELKKPRDLHEYGRLLHFRYCDYCDKFYTIIPKEVYPINTLPRTVNEENNDE